MILVLAIAVALAIGALRGGRLSSLANLSARWGGLAVVAFAIQAVFIFVPPSSFPRDGWGWPEALFTASHLLLLGAVWANRRQPGVWWIGAGMLLNLSVMLANGGWMPVTPQALTRAGHLNLVTSVAPGTRVQSSKSVLLPPEQTRLWVLSDIFVLPPPFPVPSVFSVGDVLIAWGVIQLIQAGMLSGSVTPRPAVDQERTTDDSKLSFSDYRHSSH